jgi:hypothetical protein
MLTFGAVLLIVVTTLVSVLVINPLPSFKL